MTERRQRQIEFEIPIVEPAAELLEIKDIHPDLPQPPFFVGIIGPRHSGKSVMLYNILSEKEGMYGQAFKKSNIVLYSPTKDFDKTLKELHLDHVYGPPTEVQQVVNEILSQQRKFQEADEMTGVLLVLDDATQIRKGWGPVEELGYTGRHLGTQVFYVAHKMSSIPRGIRTQTQQWLLYEPHEMSEKDWVLDMFSDRTTRNLWRNALQRAWLEPYQFVYVDFEERDFIRKYRKGFHEPLFLPEEMNQLIGRIIIHDVEQIHREQVNMENEVESVRHERVEQPLQRRNRRA